MHWIGNDTVRPSRRSVAGAEKQAEAVKDVKVLPNAPDFKSPQNVLACHS